MGIQLIPALTSTRRFEFRVSSQSHAEPGSDEGVKVSDKVSIRFGPDAMRQQAQQLALHRTHKRSEWCSRRESNPEPWDLRDSSLPLVTDLGLLQTETWHSSARESGDATSRICPHDGCTLDVQRMYATFDRQAGKVV